MLGCSQLPVIPAPDPLTHFSPPVVHAHVGRTFTQTHTFFFNQGVGAEKREGVHLRHVCGAQDNLRKPILSFCRVGSGD